MTPPARRKKETPRKAPPSVVLLDAAPDELDFGDWHIEPLRIRITRHNWSIPVHVHPGFHQVFVLERGRVEAVIDGDALCGEAPLVLAAPAGAPHGFRFTRGAAGYVLTFKTHHLRSGRADILPAIEDDLLSGAAVLRFTPDETCWMQLLGLINVLQTENMRHESDQSAVKRVLLEAAIVLLARRGAEFDAPAHGAKSKSDLFRRFERCVDERLCDHAAVSEVAQELGVSESTLNRLCQAHAGSTAARYIRSRLFLEARRRLTYSDAGIQEIAYDLGFADLGYFSRFITRESGASPRELRQALRAAAYGG